MIIEKDIDFMRWRHVTAVASTVLVLASILSLAINGLNFGLDFTSGTAVRLSYAEPVVISELNETLRTNGYEDAVVVSFGSDRDVRVVLPVDEDVELGNQAEQAAEVGEAIVAMLRRETGQEITLQGSDYVSAKVGEELTERGGLGMLVALGIIMIYISVRFQFKFAVGAVLALAHDVLITLGIFSITGMEFNLNTLAAMLAIIGYSLNDTIVVSDRIRENFRRMRQGTPMELVNTSLSQILGRTIVTSFTTLLVLFAVLFVGGETTRGFAIALIIGVIIGTYSSIYVASNTILRMRVTREDLMVPVKEGAELDGMP